MSYLSFYRSGEFADVVLDCKSDETAAQSTSTAPQAAAAQDPAVANAAPASPATPAEKASAQSNLPPVRCHRVVLSAASEYFRKRLNGKQETPSQVVASTGDAASNNAAAQPAAPAAGGAAATAPTGASGAGLGSVTMPKEVIPTRFHWESFSQVAVPFMYDPKVLDSRAGTDGMPASQMVLGVTVGHSLSVRGLANVLVARLKEMCDPRANSSDSTSELERTKCVEIFVACSMELTRLGSSGNASAPGTDPSTVATLAAINKDLTDVKNWALAKLKENIDSLVALPSLSDFGRIRFVSMEAAKAVCDQVSVEAPEVAVAAKRILIVLTSFLRQRLQRDYTSFTVKGHISQLDQSANQSTSTSVGLSLMPRVDISVGESAGLGRTPLWSGAANLTGTKASAAAPSATGSTATPVSPSSGSAAPADPAAAGSAPAAPAGATSTAAATPASQGDFECTIQVPTKASLLNIVYFNGKVSTTLTVVLGDSQPKIVTADEGKTTFTITKVQPVVAAPPPAAAGAGVAAGSAAPSAGQGATPAGDANAQANPATPASPTSTGAGVANPAQPTSPQQQTVKPALSEWDKYCQIFATAPLVGFENPISTAEFETVVGWVPWSNMETADLQQASETDVYASNFAKDAIMKALFAKMASDSGSRNSPKNPASGSQKDHTTNKTLDPTCGQGKTNFQLPSSPKSFIAESICTLNVEPPRKYTSSAHEVAIPNRAFAMGDAPYISPKSEGLHVTRTVPTSPASVVSGPYRSNANAFGTPYTSPQQRQALTNELRLDFNGDLSDAKGLFYYLGSRGFKTVWQNPHNAGSVRVFTSGLGFGQLDTAVGRSSCNHLRTTNRANSYLGVDLQYDRRFLLTGYLLSCRNDGTQLPISWAVEGSVDGDKWITLDERNLSDSEAATAHWKRTTQYFPVLFGATGDCSVDSNSFRLFRIVQTGVNSSGSNNLSLSFVEIFGMPTSGVF